MNHPVFKHRTFVSISEKPEDFGNLDLIDCVGLSVERTEAIILQMQCQFEGDGNKVSDSINISVLEAIRNELLDIKTVVSWHAQNSLDKEKEKSHE